MITIFGIEWTWPRKFSRLRSLSEWERQGVGPRNRACLHWGEVVAFGGTKYEVDMGDEAATTTRLWTIGGLAGVSTTCLLLHTYSE